MADTNLIACLYPAGGSLSVERALQTIHMADNSSRFISPQAVFIDGHCSRDSSQSLEEEEDDNKPPAYIYSEGLQLRFDQPRKNRLGILIGTSPGCDIIIPKMESLRAVSRHQCAITFDHQGRLVLQDLREPNVSNSGTAVTCNGRGGTKRRGFTWILSGAEFIASTELTIVIALDDHLKFRIVVAPHDIHSELYKEKVAQFRRAVATNGDGPSFQERDWQNPESSAALNGVQTPNSEAVWDPNL